MSLVQQIADLATRIGQEIKQIKQDYLLSSAISAWAKSATKPSYTPSEVGALPSSSYTAADVLAKIKSVDGTGSGLDADTLDGQEATSFCKSFGTITFNPNGLDASCTTAEFITFLTTLGFFNYNHASAKGSWDYAGNNDISDTGFGACDLAGAVVETWTDGTCKTIKIIRPVTGSGGSQVLIYNDQGSSYSPGWRQVWTSATDGAGSGLDADLLDGNHASAFVRTSDSRLTDARPASDVYAWAKAATKPTYTASEVGAAALNSPAFTGTPTAPTPASGDNSTKLATTAFIQDALSTLSPMNTTNNFTLAENMTAGDPAILRRDGKIEMVSGYTTQLQTPVNSNAVVFLSGGSSVSPYNNSYLDADFDPINGNRFIIACRASGSPNNGLFVVGTITNGVISFGSVYSFTTGAIGTVRIKFDPLVAGRFVIFFCDNSVSYYPTAIIGTLDASNVPTFGQKNVISSSSGNYYNYGFDFDPFNTGKLLFAYPVSSTLTLAVGNISGDTISKGTPLTLLTTTYAKVMFDDLNPNKVFVAYDSFVKLKSFTISGTGVSALGPENALITSNSGRSSIDKIKGEAGKFIASSSVSTATGSSGMVYAQLDATDTAKVVCSASPNNPNTYVCCGPVGQPGKYAFPAVYTYSSAPRVVPYELSVDRSTMATQATYSQVSSSAKIPIVIFDYKGGKYYVVITEEGNAYIGSLTALVSNAKETAVAGILQESGSAGQSKPVLLLGGIDETQTGLTPSQDYYINPIGGLTTSTGETSVLLGRSLSANKLVTRPFFYK